MTQQPPDPVQQEVLGALARWVVTEFPTDAGWDGLHLQLRPLRDEVPFRVVEVRGEVFIPVEAFERLNALQAELRGRSVEEDRAKWERRPAATPWMQTQASPSTRCSTLRSTPQH